MSSWQPVLPCSQDPALGTQPPGQGQPKEPVQQSVENFYLAAPQMSASSCPPAASHHEHESCSSHLSCPVWSCVEHRLAVSVDYCPHCRSALQIITVLFKPLSSEVTLYSKVDNWIMIQEGGNAPSFLLFGVVEMGCYSITQPR